MQRQNTKAHIGIARSLTLDSMKLPSISNGSIANGSIYTTKSNKETTTKKVGVQVSNILKFSLAILIQCTVKPILGDPISMFH